MSDLPETNITHTFWCGGCHCYHFVDRRWSVTDGPNGATVRPSILVQRPREPREERCHLFITDGQIEYLNDSTHELRGRTVALDEFEEVQKHAKDKVKP